MVAQIPTQITMMKMLPCGLMEVVLVMGNNGDYSLDFNGVSNNVNINTYGFPGGNNQITVSTWFYREQNIGSTGEYLFSYGDFFGQSFGLGIYGNGYLFVTFDGI